MAKEWIYKTGDCLNEVTTWEGLTVVTSNMNKKKCDRVVSLEWQQTIILN
jgi:hypothetical protein